MSGQWAPDPYGRAEYRWWDGANWTPHVSTSGQVTQEDPATFASAAVANPVAAAGAAASPAAAFPAAVFPQVASPEAGFPATGFPAAGFPGFPGYATPAGVGTAASAGKTNGMLTAASIMQLFQGVIGAIFGLWLLAAAQSTLGGLVDDLSGGAITGAGLVLLVFSAGLILLSIQCLRRRRGAWITTVVFQGIVVVFMFLAFVSALGDSGGDANAGGAVLPLLYTGATLGLAIVGGRRQFSTGAR